MNVLKVLPPVWSERNMIWSWVLLKDLIVFLEVERLLMAEREDDGRMEIEEHPEAQQGERWGTITNWWWGNKGQLNIYRTFSPTRKGLGECLRMSRCINFLGRTHEHRVKWWEKAHIPPAHQFRATETTFNKNWPFTSWSGLTAAAKDTISLTSFGV